MKRSFALFLFLFSFSSLASNFCPNVWFSGWYCDAGDAVHCAYDYYYDEYYEDTYINCRSLPNSYGCYAGNCACISSCAHGTQNRDCTCSCSYPWSGLRCDTCVRNDYECGNNGYINRQNCQCNCPNACLNGGTAGANCACTCPSPWAGARCETCTRSSSECANGGHMDPTTCQCVCPNTCQNGGVQDKNCGCTCPAPWQGTLCQTCGMSQSNCANNSTLNTALCQCNCVKGCENSGSLTRTCDCNCPYPWISKFCETCSISASHCKNNATFAGATACACDCTNANTCQHSGRLMSDYSCGCDCVSGWTGNDCSTCGRDSSFCVKGTFKQPSCNCDCTGVVCKNGKLNERCQCICNNGYVGEDCGQASAAGSLKPSATVTAIAVGVAALLGLNVPPANNQQANAQNNGEQQ